MEEVEFPKIYGGGITRDLAWGAKSLGGGKIPATPVNMATALLQNTM